MDCEIYCLVYRQRPSQVVHMPGSLNLYMEYLERSFNDTLCLKCEKIFFRTEKNIEFMHVFPFFQFNMQSFFARVPSPEVVAQLRVEIEPNQEWEGSCVLWTGRVNKYGYSVHRIMHNHKRVSLPVHRITYFLLDPSRPLDPNLHVSHLCHVKRCVNSEHLSLEPCKINNHRRKCKSEGECTGHHGFKCCILVTIAYIDQ